MTTFKYKNIGIKLFHSSILLIPGFLYALFSISLSSNRFLADKSDSTITLLNLLQLLAFGITVAKYAADQMLLSKLHSGETTSLKSFFLKRVFPFTLVFCLIPFYSYGLFASMVLLFCIPVEVYVIISVIELNISEKYIKALFISLLGYPLLFLTYIFFSIHNHLSVSEILLIFLFVSALKLSIVSYKRSKNQQKEIRNDVLTTDSMVPIQQASNYLLFKADQVVIASNVLHFSPLQSFLPIDYLFYTKLIELFSGITTSLSPMISGFRFEEKSIWQFFKNKTYASLVIAAVFIQISVTLFLLKNPDKLHLLMLIPFVMTTILIVPVTLINFYYYRNNKLRKANVNNIISLITGAIIMALSVFIKSPLLFSFIVPAQLLLFILAYRFSMSRS